MEADLERYYQRDFLDYYRGTLTARKLQVLISQLPYDSATARSQNGGIPVWGPAEHLIADLWSLIVGVNSEKGSPYVEQPRRAEMEMLAHIRDKESRIDRLKAVWRAKKQQYGMG